MQSQIYKFTLTSPDGKTHNQTDHILTDRREHSRVLDVSSSKRIECDTDHYLVVAEVRRRLSVSKWDTQKFDMEKFNLRKLNEVEGKVKSQTGLQFWKIQMLM
jgi:hypothetical protein